MSEYNPTHQLAHFVGDLPTQLLQTIPPLIKASTEERNQLVQDGLATLRAHNQLTDSEVTQLSTIFSSLHDASVPLARRAELVDTVQQELTAANAGPVAQGIASIVSKSSHAIARFSERQRGSGITAFDIGDVSTWQGAACAGAIVGATAGILGGPAGVLAGAAAGALGGVIGYGVGHALLE